jgi:hypothetical protein
MTLENETWVIDAGDAVMRKRAKYGATTLTRIDRLIYCLWVADYGMRNAGDLTTASDLYEHFQAEALELSSALEICASRSAFALPIATLEQQYFERFDAICDEIRSAVREASARGR